MRLAIFLLFFIVLRATGQPEAESFFVDTVRIEGNDKTKRAIILRELEFQKGDTIAASRLEPLIKKSKSNLLNTELFNFVSIDKKTRGRHVSIFINVTEQWYSWVFPVFEIADRNFNTWWETKDFSRADYGLLIIQENFRGRSEYLTMKMITGYNEYLNFQYKIPYIDQDKVFGLEFNAKTIRKHETKVITHDDELTFFKQEDTYPFKQNHGEIKLTYRPGINNVHALSFTYDDYSFHDTLLTINPDYLDASHSNTRFMSLKYTLESDYRDYASYPLHGHYLKLSAAQNGIGLFDNEVNFWKIQGEYANYFQLEKRLYFASSFNGMLSREKNHPFFLNEAMGYSDFFVRSYESNVINGDAFGLVRSNLKYTLIPTKTFSLDFLPLKQFRKVFFALYLNIFADAGYVDGFANWNSNGNRLPNNFLFGKGIGLDLVTYYEKVLRVEYSWNKNNEGGIFLHFTAPI